MPRLSNPAGSQVGEASRPRCACTAAQLGKFDRHTARGKKFIKPIRMRNCARDRYLLQSVSATGGRGRVEKFVESKTRSPICHDKLSNRMTTAMPDNQRTLDEILNLAAAQFKVPREKLAPDDDFFKTLGIDSLQALDLLTRLEHHFNVELPDYELQGVSDFRTLASRIQARL
jgi:acyl carrier protein